MRNAGPASLTLVPAEGHPAWGALRDLALGLATEAAGLAGRLAPDRCRLKVGKELFTRAGPQLVRDLGARGFDVFLDLKYHDIPNTVGQACAAAADLGVWMLIVHALGGRRMMEAARTAVEKSGRRPLLIAVTVLTSLDSSALHATGVAGGPRQQVLRLARLAMDAGADGLVCSAQEAPMLRDALGSRPVLVVPGIRPAGAGPDDQARTVTPREAVEAGADWIVVGRPITGSADPAAAAAAIASEIA